MVTKTKGNTAEILSKNPLPKEGEVIGGQTIKILTDKNEATLIAAKSAEVANTIYFRNDLESLFQSGEIVSFSQYPKKNLVIHGTAMDSDEGTLNAMQRANDFGIAVLKNGAIVIGRHPSHGSVAAGPLAMINSDPSTLEHSINVECTLATKGTDTEAPNPNQRASLTRLQGFLKTWLGYDLQIVSSADVVTGNDKKLVRIQYNPTTSGVDNYGPHGDGVSRGPSLPGRPTDIQRYTKPLEQCTADELNIYLDAIEAHLAHLQRKAKSFAKLKSIGIAERTAEKAKVEKIMGDKTFVRKKSATPIPGTGDQAGAGGLDRRRGEHTPRPGEKPAQSTGGNSDMTDNSDTNPMPETGETVAAEPEVVVDVKQLNLLRGKEKAASIVSIPEGVCVPGEKESMDNDALEKAKALILRVKSELGIDIRITSGFRGYDLQKSIREAKWNGGRGDSKRSGTDIKNIPEEKRANTILEYSQAPGTSRHHRGTDVDFVIMQGGKPSDLKAESYTTGKPKKFYDWMKLHAREYGYGQPYTPGRASGVAEEPRHWSFLPKAVPLYQQQVALLKSGKYPIEGFQGSHTLTADELLPYVDNISADCKVWSGYPATTEEKEQPPKQNTPPKGDAPKPGKKTQPKPPATRRDGGDY